MPGLPNRTFLFFYLQSILFAGGLTAQPNIDIDSLHLLGSYEIPYTLRFQKTPVGGLSGIDYDAANKRYFMISDDRSAFSPARFYTASIALSAKGISAVHFTGVTILLQANGKPYPNKQQDPLLTPDPEGIRYNPKKRQLTWSNEGERAITDKDTILQNPSLTNISLNGKYTGAYTTPDNFFMQAVDKGPRQNSTWEGLSFADNYTSLFVSSEEPLYEDGPAADIANRPYYTRLLQFDVASRRNTRQFAYRLEPVAVVPYPADGNKMNGISEILFLGNNKLLVVERAYASGAGFSTRVFVADLAAATDIKDMASLKTGDGFTPAAKKLVLNMDRLGIYIDNIEGVCFGPVLPNGHKTLLFIADNNFNPLEQSQLLLFEIND